MAPKKTTNCKGLPLGSGTTSAKRKEVFAERGRQRELKNMSTEDKKVDWTKEAKNTKRAKKLSEAEVKAFFLSDEEKKQAKEEEEKKKKEAEKESTLDKKVDAASVVKTEAAGGVDKTLPSSSSSQPAAAAENVDKTLPAKDSVKSVVKTRISEFEEKSVPHNPLDGVKKETPALRAWEETKKGMKGKKEEEEERQARQAAGESTPPDWKLGS